MLYLNHRREIEKRKNLKPRKESDSDEDVRSYPTTYDLTVWRPVNMKLARSGTA